MQTTVRSMFRRQAWMKWLPPIAARSPSPVKTTTWSVGSASFTPVANASARPWVVWSESAATYPAAREEQPIPETTTVRSGSQPMPSTAAMVQFRIVPFEQPLHQMCGRRSARSQSSKVIAAPPPGPARVSAGVWSSPPSFGAETTGRFVCRSTSLAICPRFCSGTMKAVAFGNSASAWSGNGQTRRRRRTPIFSSGRSATSWATAREGAP